MLKVAGCITHDHDLRLVAVSAIICLLGCFTTTTFLARATRPTYKHPYRWLVSAATVFGLSVWALHFVAMLAFMPDLAMAYSLDLTALSIVVSVGGVLAALLVWRAPALPRWRVLAGGVLLGLAVMGMHYIGVAAMTFSGFLLLDRETVAASVLLSVLVSSLALVRASDLGRTRRRVEVSGWLTLAICGLHFTGMSAITIAPGAATATKGVVFGTMGLAIAVGGVSVAILLMSLVGLLLEAHLSQRTVRELGRMRLLSNLAQEVLFIHQNGVVLEINNAGERLFKAPAEALIGQKVASLFTDDSLPALCRRERSAPLERRREEFDIRTLHGTSIPVELSCQPIDYLGRPATAVALRDLTDRKRDEERIRHLARHDALTGLPNRYNLQERLDAALDIAAQKRVGLALLYIDLDRFKPVNDLYGHAIGDVLLIQVAKRLQAQIQSIDMLARIGGDEFVMVLASETQPDRISVVAQHVMEAVLRPFQIEGHRIEVGASIGIAIYPDDGGSADTLMRAADAAMYRVKDKGRGALQFYEASMDAQLQERLQLGHELAGAIERGEFVLHYQPMVNGVTGAVETLEALIRWNHPRRGMVPPGTFIPLAEETGQIDQIGRWVIETACRDATGWHHPWRVSVNVSPSQFRQSDVCAIIATALHDTALSPGQLVVEITEGVLIDDTDKAIETLQRLRDLGVRIALDDFGTGYSSLSYLQRFRFDKFKIDKSFVTRLGESENALTLTRSIVNLGHNLGLKVTAEGVETQAQLAILQSLGCDQVQGYLVARPAPVPSFTELDQARVRATFAATRSRLSA